MNDEVDAQFAGDLFDALLVAGLLYGSGRSHMQVLELKEPGGERLAQTLGDIAERRLVAQHAQGE